MTEALKIGDKVIVDLKTPSSSFHKAEGVVVEPSEYNPASSATVKITKQSPQHNKYSYVGSSHKVGEESHLVNLTKLEPAFKVGDRVTVKGWEKKSEISTWEGRTGKVYLVGTYGDPTVCIRFEDGLKPSSGGWEPKYLVPAESESEPEPKFKVGDWVKVSGRNDKWDGTVGTVQKVRTELSYWGLPLYTIHRPESKVDTVFYEDHLVATEAPVKTFKKGDIVKHKAGAHKYLIHEGKDYFIVDEVVPKLKYPVRVRALGQKDARGYTYDELELDGTPLSQWEIELLDGATAADITPKSAADEYLLASSLSRATVTADFSNSTKAEAVDGPAHYGGKDNPYEVIKVAEAWGFEKNAYLFNALKYLGRAGKKGSKVEDLKKLVFYVEREIGLEEASGN